MVINQILVEYYETYFHPFNGFTDGEKEELRKHLLLEDKMNGDYESTLLMNSGKGQMQRRYL
jgi:hypothetical protein